MTTPERPRPAFDVLVVAYRKQHRCLTPMGGVSLEEALEVARLHLLKSTDDVRIRRSR